MKQRVVWVLERQVQYRQKWVRELGVWWEPMESWPTRAEARVAKRYLKTLAGNSKLRIHPYVPLYKDY